METKELKKIMAEAVDQNSHCTSQLAIEDLVRQLERIENKLGKLAKGIVKILNQVEQREKLH